jgi:hypothetical protein
VAAAIYVAVITRITNVHSVLLATEKHMRLKLSALRSHSYHSAVDTCKDLIPSGTEYGLVVAVTAISEDY